MESFASENTSQVPHIGFLTQNVLGQTIWNPYQLNLCMKTDTNDIIMIIIMRFTNAAFCSGDPNFIKAGFNHTTYCSGSCFNQGDHIHSVRELSPLRI